MTCWTQEEIAEAVGVPQRTVADRFSENGNLAKIAKSAQAMAEHATDSGVPVYNVWKRQTKSGGSNHFGNSESRWLDNLHSPDTTGNPSGFTLIFEP